MWKIKRPLLQAALNDIDSFLNKNVIANADVAPLKDLVRQYDSQNGDVNQQQLQTISKVVADEMVHNYKVRIKKDGMFSKIRKELMKNVPTCPYCGVGEPDTLDHFMPKEDYKELASCRLNLIPACGTCNGYKGTKNYKGFIHPYYAILPRGQVFLKARVKVDYNSLVIEFYVDRNVITNTNLFDQISNQWEELNLNERLTKSYIVHLNNYFIKSYGNSDILLSVLENDLALKEENYGLNDWRCALMRTLIEELNGTNRNMIFDAINNDIDNSRSDNV